MVNIMKYFKISSFKKQKYLKAFLFLSIFSFILSFFLFMKLNNTVMLNEIGKLPEFISKTHLNFFFMHFFLLFVIFLLSLTGLSIIVLPIYLVFEEICIFYNIFSFTYLYSFTGFLFSLIYIILTKAVYLYFIFLIFKKLINITKHFLSNINNKTSYPYKAQFKKIGFLIILIFLNDMFLYFWGSFILSKFLFLLKQ